MGCLRWGPSEIQNFALYVLLRHKRFPLSPRNSQRRQAAPDGSLVPPDRPFYSPVFDLVRVTALIPAVTWFRAIHGVRTEFQGGHKVT